MNGLGHDMKRKSLYSLLPYISMFTTLPTLLLIMACYSFVTHVLNPMDVFTFHYWLGWLLAFFCICLSIIPVGGSCGGPYTLLLFLFHFKWSHVDYILGFGYELWYSHVIASESTQFSLFCMWHGCVGALFFARVAMALKFCIESWDFVRKGTIVLRVLNTEPTFIFEL